MPEVFRFYGFSFFFYSKEHEPLHIHVEGKDGCAKFDLVDDGIRPMGNEYQKKVDEAMLDLVNNLDLPIITIKGDKQERLTKCLEKLLRIENYIIK
jgi:hypothetical protein